MGRRPLDRAVRTAREEQIIRYRKDGWRTEDIARTLGLSRTKIYGLASQLITDGRLERRPRGRPSSRDALTDDAWEKLKIQILCLRDFQALKGDEIVERLHVTKWLLARAVAEMMSDGWLESRSGAHAQSHALARQDPEKDLRLMIILAMARQGETHKAIGAVLGLTRERIRQLQNSVVSVQGDEILSQEVVRLAVLARSLGTQPARLRKLCAAASILFYPGTGGAHVLTTKDADRARKACAEWRRRPCVVCGKPFTRGRLVARQLVCSTACRERRRAQLRAQSFTAPPTTARLRGWHRELWRRLRGRTPPARDRWVTILEAARVSGLGQVQIWWLLQRKIFSSRPHPTARWRRDHARPVTLCALSEVRLAARIFRSFHHPRKRGKRRS